MAVIMYKHINTLYNTVLYLK